MFAYACRSRPDPPRSGGPGSSGSTPVGLIRQQATDPPDVPAYGATGFDDGPGAARQEVSPATNARVSAVGAVMAVPTTTLSAPAASASAACSGVAIRPLGDHRGGDRGGEVGDEGQVRGGPAGGTRHVAGQRRPHEVGALPGGRTALVEGRHVGHDQGARRVDGLDELREGAAVGARARGGVGRDDRGPRLHGERVGTVVGVM
ncbi:hypothetical protein SGRIM128S_03182 [Streptomyces griseomycini]